MNAYKDVLLDKDGNEFYPKTVTDNVYTPNGERMDNVLETIGNTIDGIGTDYTLLATIPTSLNGTHVDVPNMREYREIFACLVGQVNSPVIKVPYPIFKARGLTGYGFSASYINAGKSSSMHFSLTHVSDTKVAIYAETVSYTITGVQIYGIK